MLKVDQESFCKKKYFRNTENCSEHDAETPVFKLPIWTEKLSENLDRETVRKYFFNF